MGACGPPWGQSLLRSCLAAHSSPPPPPAYVLSAFGTPVKPIRLPPKHIATRVVASTIILTRDRNRFGRRGSTKRAKPHHANARDADLAEGVEQGICGPTEQVVDGDGKVVGAVLGRQPGQQSPFGAFASDLQPVLSLHATQD